MSFYYFHIENSGGRTVDNEGSDFIDDGSARAHALRGVRDLLSGELKERGVIDLRGHVSVSDIDGTEKFRITFPQAIEIIR